MNIFKNYIEMRLGLGWLDEKTKSSNKLVIDVYRRLIRDDLVLDKCLYTFKNW